MTCDLLQSKNWTFTDYEFKDWEKLYKENDRVRYICYGEEICPKTKKKHLQGWLQLMDKKRLSEIKKVCQSKQMHMEPCFGIESENDKYCKKDGQYSCLGEYITQGKRTDLDGIKKLIDEGKPLLEVANENFPSFIKYHKGFTVYKTMVDKVKRKDFRKVKVVHIWGETGIGKTRKAMEDSNAYKIQGCSMKWWDGYEGEETLIIDDYNDDLKITELLGILDGYQLRLAVKGGFTYANWNKIIITTNYRSLHKRSRRQHRKALKRRITEVINLCRSA